jgi:hypothetical protein
MSSSSSSVSSSSCWTNPLENMYEELEEKLTDRLAKLEERVKQLDKLAHDLEWFVCHRAGVTSIETPERI